MMKMNDSSHNDDNYNNKGKNVKDIKNEDLLNFKYPTSNIEEDDISKYFLENNDVGRIMEDIFKESPLPPHYSQHGLSNSIQNLNNNDHGTEIPTINKDDPPVLMSFPPIQHQAPEIEISIDFAEAVLQNFQLVLNEVPKRVRDYYKNVLYRRTTILQRQNQYGETIRTDTMEEIFTNYIDTRLISLLFIDDKL
ncbi:hypothetical protein CsatA_018840 [Cannabis sativa]